MDVLIVCNRQTGLKKGMFLLEVIKTETIRNEYGVSFEHFI